MLNKFSKKQLISFIKKSETVCLAGHRPNKLPWKYNENLQNCIFFKKELKNILINTIQLGYKNFLVGMAQGFDMISAEILLEIKKQYKEIKLIAVLPCKNQNKEWDILQKNRYKTILKKCNNIIILAKKYTNSCMNDRNKYMIENSNFVIACYNGNPSGTKNTVEYAKESNLKILIINPLNYKN